MLLFSSPNPSSPPKRPFLWIDKEIADEFEREAAARMKELKQLAEISGTTIENSISEEADKK